MSRTPNNLWVGSVGPTVVHCLIFSWATIATGEMKMYQRAAPFMGTQWNIALYSSDPETANRAFEQAFAMIDQIDQALSNYRRDSELNQLSRSSAHQDFVPVSDHLFRVLREAGNVSKATAGAFDVTIGPLSKRWRRARARKMLPTEAVLSAARRHVGYQYVELDEQSRGVRLTRSGMLLDLGGIAKGYAVDQALDAIRGCGIHSALVNGGGDLAAADPPPHQQGWEITIAGLRPSDPPAKTRLANAAIATSGDAWQFLEIDGTRYSHIIDPRTGVGLTHRIGVSVIAPTCMQADAWASAVCVAPEKTVRVLRDDPSLHWMITRVEESGIPQRRWSPGFPR